MTFKDFKNWLWGLPKCTKGGRCNADRVVKKWHSDVWFWTSRYYCTKCSNEIK